MPPEGFEKCERAGGKIKTMKGPNKMMGLEDGEHMKICVMDGKVHKGYVEKTEKKNKK